MPHKSSEDRKRCVREYQKRFYRDNTRITQTLTKAEYAFFSRIAERNGVSVPKTIKNAALAYYKGETLPPSELQKAFEKSIKEFQKIGNNINQVAHFVHARNKQKEGVSLDELNKAVLDIYALQKQLKSGLYKAFESYYKRP